MSALELIKLKGLTVISHRHFQVYKLCAMCVIWMENQKAENATLRLYLGCYVSGSLVKNTGHRDLYTSNVLCITNIIVKHSCG